MRPGLQFDSDPLLPRVRTRLRAIFGDLRPGERLSPLDQLVRSELGGRTLDEISWTAFYLLKARFPDWNDAIAAGPAAVEVLIADVTRAHAKAVWLVEALTTIKAWQGELSLDFIGGLPTEAAFRKLRNLMGVGPKVAASVLNFSTFARPVLVVDTHVARVAHRLGLVAAVQDLDRAHRELTEILDPAWDADDLYELHRLMKRHGQETCHALVPGCKSCALADLCPQAVSSMRRTAVSKPRSEAEVLSFSRPVVKASMTAG
jgi:endonuclease-3